MHVILGFLGLFEQLFLRQHGIKLFLKAAKKKKKKKKFHL